VVVVVHLAVVVAVLVAYVQQLQLLVAVDH
jgi:hypothetical protein